MCGISPNILWPVTSAVRYFPHTNRANKPNNSPVVQHYITTTSRSETFTNVYVYAKPLFVKG